MKHGFLRLIGSLVFIAAVLAALPAEAQLTPAEQAGLNLGIDANYAVVDLGATTFGWNSGPVNGSVLVGQGVTVKLSGGNNGGFANNMTQFLYTDGTANISGNLQNPITEKTVPATTTETALTDAQSVSNYASSLSPTQTEPSTINGTTTITGSGGLNVIDVANIQNAKLTISGTANDFFVFNVTDQIQTNQPMTLLGVSASQILFNLTGTGTVAVFQTSGGDVSYGTYLATHGGTFQFSNLDLTGRLINTAGNIQLVSGSSIPTVPEPATIGLLGVGLAALGISRKRSRKAA